MTAKRLGAVLVAVALVAVGFVIRNARAGDGAPDDTSSPTSGPSDPDPTDERAVICVPELAAACEAIAAAQPDRSARTAAAATTFDALVAGDADDAPIWITAAPGPGMVDVQRTASGDEPLALEVTALASTPLVVVASQERLDALAGTCGDVDIWACLGDHAGEPWADLGGQASWGTLRPSIGDVDASVTALASFRAAASGYFGTTDFTRSSWESDTRFLGWLRPLVRTVGAADLSAGTPLATMVTRPSALDVAATTDAELAALGSRAETLARKYPRTAMSLDAVIAAPPGAGGTDELAELASAALTGSGWEPPADQVGPSASTTLALIELWEATT